MYLNEMMVSLADPSTHLWLGITCERIMGLLKSSKLQTNNPYYIEDELLMRNIIDNKQFFHTMVLPWVLITQILMAAHGEVGHNGSTRT